MKDANERIAKVALDLGVVLPADQEESSDVPREVGAPVKHGNVTERYADVRPLLR
jgi:hypothetical protein